MRIAVIGAGVLGAAVARELARRGADVSVYEQLTPGAGTSMTSFAWVNSHNKRPREYHDLNLAGMAEHRALQAESRSGSRWFFATGHVEWAAGGDHAADLTARVDRLASWAYPARWLLPREARALEPDLQLPEAATLIAYFPDEGYVLPALLLGRLLGDARDHGAQVVTSARADSIEISGTGATIRLGDGQTHHADAVVSCAGRWTSPLMQSAGYHVPLADPDAPGSATVGYLAWTAPLPVRLGRIVTTPQLNMRPDGGGRLVIQGLDLDGSADPGNPPSVTAPVAERLCLRLRESLAGAEHAVLDAIRVGQRSMPADGLTICGHLDPGQRLYVIATHSGITLGPLLGRLAASEILTGDRDPRLEPFRPQRFSGGPTSGEPVTAARRPGDQ